MLVQITNFAALRRQIGRDLADSIAHEVAALAQRHFPAGRVVTAGRDMIEVRLDQDGPGTLIEQVKGFGAACEAPMLLGESACRVRLAIGAAITRCDGADAVGLAEEAEQALDSAHREHQPVVRIVDDMATRNDRVNLSRDLSRAIENGELRLHYQPKVHLRRQAVVSLEALVRWQHPVRGLIQPGDFIPAAEESSDIAALTLWVIDEALAAQAQFAALGHDLPVFVNVAGTLLADVGFVADASARIIGKAGRIGFEITETSVIRDPAVAIANLRRFAELGIAIAIDDYGAGLSSLAYLKQLPACELKIDKLFVTQLASSHRDPLIVRSTIDLAHAMEMEVVAEGVETQSVLALLSVMGCDMAQGYLISRPLDASAMRDFLAKHGSRWTAETAPSPLFRIAHSRSGR